MMVESETRQGSPAAAWLQGGHNISKLERWISMSTGIGLAAFGITRQRPSGYVIAALGAMLFRRGITAHCDVYQAMGIDTATGGGDTRAALGGSAGVLVEESVTINRSAEELYRFWRNFENLPRFMRHLESVEPITETISRWRAKGPAGMSVEWNAEVNNEVPNKLIGWRSLEGSEVVSAGSVNFEKAGRGTRLRVRLQYSPPGGKAGAAIARLVGRDAATEIREDLRRFKQQVESGEVVP
ncbi:SRPBCC family protein [soil metagenome]